MKDKSDRITHWATQEYYDYGSDEEPEFFKCQIDKVQYEKINI